MSEVQSVFAYVEQLLRGGEDTHVTPEVRAVLVCVLVWMAVLFLRGSRQADLLP